MLDEWERETPGRRQIMFRALRTVRPSHLLDTGLFDFAGLRPGGGPLAPWRPRGLAPSSGRAPAA